MSHKSSFTSFCKDFLTVTSLSIVATVSVPSQGFSLTTEIGDIEEKSVKAEERSNNSFTNFLNGEESNFLIAKKDDHKHKDKDKDRKDHDDDDDDDDDDDKYHRYGDDRKEKKHYSSKAFRVQEWNGSFKVNRLVNSKQRALVLYLDILGKPDTKYANVVHTVYARQNNGWVKFYSTSGTRRIEKNGKKYFLNPEVIEFSRMRYGNVDLSRSDLRVVTEILYDIKGNRAERLVLEDVWNYSSITEINSITQLTTVSTTTTTSTQNVSYNNNYNRRDNDRRRTEARREDRKEEKRYSSKAFRVQEWNGSFKVNRLVNSKQRALVLYLDILGKPDTKYANVLHTVYARQNNSWVKFYSTSGTRRIEKKGKNYFLTPEVIEFSRMRYRNVDLSRSDIRVVTEILYDIKGNREERLVLEDVWNYSSITEINSITQLTTVSTTTTQTGSYNNNYNRRDDDDDRRRTEARRQDKKGQKRYSYKAYKDKDWDCIFKLGRLVNTNNKAFLVHLDILNKPATKYANVVYLLYARQNNRWVQVHNSTGSRLITKKGNKYFLNPEVIEFSKLRLGNINLSTSDLKFVTEIRYDTTTRREQRVVVENTWNYSSINEITRVEELEVEDI